MTDKPIDPLQIPVPKPYSEEAPSPQELNEAQKKAEVLVKEKAPEIPDEKIKIKKKGVNLKKFGVVAIIVFMIVGTFTAVKLTQQRQEYRSQAEDQYPCEVGGGTCKSSCGQGEHKTGGDCGGSGVCCEPSYSNCSGQCYASNTCPAGMTMTDETSCGPMGVCCVGGQPPPSEPPPPGPECTSDDDCGPDECCNHQTCGSCEPPGGSSTPTPTATATPSTPPGLVCSGLNYTPVSPIIGDDVDFTCSGSGGVIDHYEFQYSIDSGAWVDIPKPGFGNGQTVSMTIQTPGAYVVRCRACTSIDGSNCTAYQTL